MRVHSLRTSVLSLVAAAAAGVAGAIAPVATAGADSSCGRLTTSVAVPARTPVADWSENLAYDAQGDLWVTRVLRGTVDRYSPSGRKTGSVAVSEPGGIAQGPDGLMYVNSGTSPLNEIPGGPRRGTVVRFDPRQAAPKAHVFARGFTMPNGLTFGPDRALYVADSGAGLFRVRPNGSIDRGWTARAPKAMAPGPLALSYGTNGITAVGSLLYVTTTTSATGRVVVVPIGDPAAAKVLDLTAPLPGTLDDLALLPDGRLAVASATGRLVAVNPTTGVRCTYDVGQPVTSVAVDPADPHRLTAGTESGDVLSLRIR